MQIANLDRWSAWPRSMWPICRCLKDKREAFISVPGVSRNEDQGHDRADSQCGRGRYAAAGRSPQDVDRTVATVVLKVDAAEAAKLLGGTVQDAGTALMGLQVDVEIPL